MQNDDFFFWELQRQTRKLLGASLITVTRPRGVVVQGLSVLFLYMVAMVIEVRFDAFKDKSAERLERFSIAVFIVTVWLAVLMSQDNFGSSTKESISILIVIINITALSVVACLLLRAESSTAKEKMQALRASLSGEPNNGSDNTGDGGGKVSSPPALEIEMNAAAGRPGGPLGGCAVVKSEGTGGGSRRRSRAAGHSSA